jgi:chaperonin cofactor prefoldin
MTSQWIVFSLKNKLATDQDLSDIIDTMRNEIHVYRKEHYEDSKFKENCFQAVWEIITKAMIADIAKFNMLKDELVPVIARIIQTNQVLEDIVNVAEKLEKKPKFFIICFYFLIFMEGSFKNVVKNLQAMNEITEKKNVSITKTLEVTIEWRNEKEKILQKILPDSLRQGIHKNLRNSIAHGNFRYYDKEDKIEFWDISPRTQKYTLKPIKLTYREFSKFLIEVELFCQIFGLIILALIAVTDITDRRRL